MGDVVVSCKFFLSVGGERSETVMAQVPRCTDSRINVFLHVSTTRQKERTVDTSERRHQRNKK